MSNNHPRVGDRYRATEHIRDLGFGLPGDGLCVGDIVRITEDHGVRVSIERESPGVATIRNGNGFHFSHFADPGAGRAFELVERAAPKNDHDLKPGDLLVYVGRASRDPRYKLEEYGTVLRLENILLEQAPGGANIAEFSYPGALTKRAWKRWSLAHFIGQSGVEKVLRRATADEQTAYQRLIGSAGDGIVFMGSEKCVHMEKTTQGIVVVSSKPARKDARAEHRHAANTTQAETTAPEPDCANNERFALRGDQPEDMAKWAAKAPDGATHVAIDYNGEVWAYYAKPVASESDKLWVYASENQYGGSGQPAKAAQLLGNVARGFQGWMYTCYDIAALKHAALGSDAGCEARDFPQGGHLSELEQLRRERDSIKWQWENQRQCIGQYQAQVREQADAIKLLEQTNAAQAARIDELVADAKRDDERYDRMREFLGVTVGSTVEQAMHNMMAQNHSLIEQLRQRTQERDTAHQALLSRKVIELSPAEVQSGMDRVRWAAGLIRQLPVTHEGRNSWLLNYGNEHERAGFFAGWRFEWRKPEADADEMAGMPVAQPTEAQVEAKRALEAVEQPRYRHIKVNGRPVRVVAPIWF